jgi:acyl-CoA synthetase (AMP-forming)/AMP-acid ligase II
MAELLIRMTGQSPGQTAMADEHTSMTWADLDRKVNQWIGVLRAHGLRGGDRIVMVLGNRPVTYEVLLACLHTGLVAVPVSWRLTAPELAYMLNDSGASAVLAEPSTAGRVAAAMRETGRSLRLAMVAGHEPRDGLVPTEGLLTGATAAEPAGQSSGSVMLYTSATTGRPKGVITGLFRCGAGLDRVERTARGLGAAFGIPSRGRALLAGPWYHAAQIFFSLFPLLRGCELVLRRRFDPAATIADFAQQRITLCHLVPTQFARMLALAPSYRESFRGGCLERVWHGGAACPVDVKRRMIEWWGPVLVEYYAATEAGIVTTIESAEWLSRPGSVGKPRPPTEVLIVDDKGAECPAGVTGSVYVRRPSKLDFEYHNAPGKTASAHRAPGTFTVGDLGRVDDDGYLFLTGRTFDTIISGGVNIYPAEVEAALLSHRGVRDVAVFGIPDNDFGEAVMAVIEADPAAGLPSEDLPEVLDAHCRGQLAGYKRPRRYRVVGSLPRRPTGKLDKQVLRAPYWERGDAG